MTGTTQSVSVEIANAPGAKCAGIDNQERKYYWNGTPSSVMVKKGDGPMKLTCEKAGFKTGHFEFDETFQGATLGNILLGGGIGLIVDAASGAAQEYPNSVKFVMEPLETASKDEKERYLRLKKEIEEEIKKKKEKEAKEIEEAANP